MAAMAALQASLIAQPQGWLALTILWTAFAFVGSCGPVAYAALAQRFPPALTGRVVTALNGSMLALVFGLQAGIGVILDLWPRTETGGWNAAGYSWALSMTLLLQVAATLWMVIWRTEPRRGNGTT
jgi:hypothetical protein